MLPIAISGAPITDAEEEATSSGREVIIASRKSPTQFLVKPVFSAIISPYWESLVPAKTMTAPLTTNCSQVNEASDTTASQKSF